MNYSAIYHKIIANRQINPLAPGQYVEKHHILPKSLGGSDDVNNIVVLSAREHFICHLLLIKMQPLGAPSYHKMLKALMMMTLCNSKHQRRTLNSKYYEKLKADCSLCQSRLTSGTGNSQYGTRWISDPNTGESKKTRGEIPPGWISGRNKKYILCRQCNKPFLPRNDYNVLCGDKQCFKLSRKNQYNSNITPS